MPIPARIAHAARTVRDAAARYERFLWIGLFAAVVLVQWPMIKGVYYRVARTPAPAAAIAWETDLDRALAEAARANKQVLVDFSADWCAPCIAMKHDVWPSAEVGRAITRSYVPLLVDVDRNGAVADRYDVESIPTVLVLDKNGRVVREASFLAARSAAAMVRFLDGKE